MKNFTTALNTYEIQTVTQTRVTRFDDNGPVKEDVTAFHIFKDGKLVTVAYDEADIEMVIDCQEHPERYAGMNNRFD